MINIMVFVSFGIFGALTVLFIIADYLEEKNG